MAVKYLHAAQVTVPFCSPDHTSWNVLICRQRQKKSENPLQAAASTKTARVQSIIRTYLTHLYSLADPDALTDGCLHREMPNVSEFLYFPLYREDQNISRKWELQLSLTEAD